MSQLTNIHQKIYWFIYIRWKMGLRVHTNTKISIRYHIPVTPFIYITDNYRIVSELKQVTPKHTLLRFFNRSDLWSCQKNFSMLSLRITNVKYVYPTQYVYPIEKNYSVSRKNKKRLKIKEKTNSPFRKSNKRYFLF